jgi:hypothetical protein
MIENLSDALNIGHEPISIRLDFSGLLGRVIFCCVLFCIFIAAAIYSGSLFLKAASLICLILLACTVPVSALAYFRIWRNSLPGLILSSEGFVDSVVSSTLVRWVDVKKCILLNSFGVPILYVKLNPVAFEKLSISKSLRFVYFRTHTLIFARGSLDCNFNDLVKCFMSRCPN